VSRSAEHAIILRHCLQAVISQVFVGAHCCVALSTRRRKERMNDRGGTADFEQVVAGCDRARIVRSHGAERNRSVLDPAVPQLSLGAKMACTTSAVEC